MHRLSVFSCTSPPHLGGDVQLGGDVHANACTVSFILFTF